MPFMKSSHFTIPYKTWSCKSGAAQTANIPVMQEWRGPDRKHPLSQKPQDLLAPLRAGHDVGLLSEAGVPGVADPGAEIVQVAHQWGAKVIPLVGPSSILLGLMASGLNGQFFRFNGYLPVDTAQRSTKLKELEETVRPKFGLRPPIETAQCCKAAWIRYRHKLNSV
ncbi:MAG: hypothetical protein RL727_1044 [Pseudomonadota bacterium]